MVDTRTYYIYYPATPPQEPIEATAGEDMRKGEVVSLIPEGEQQYAFRYLPERKGIKPEGIAERDAKKGESVRVHKPRTDK